ncbi:MAG: hypothetical protein E3J21_12380 [Anaerolineales bacterium]|nr:MAG: hypothetical protein E3J21_12380 [Anaerolineales bacterium]
MQEWKVLAQGGEGARISRCPAGHIHLDYGCVTLRFTEEDFRAFAAMVARAATNLDGTPLLKGLAALPKDVAATFSKN